MTEDEEDLWAEFQRWKWRKEQGKGVEVVAGTVVPIENLSRLVDLVGYSRGLLSAVAGMGNSDWLRAEADDLGRRLSLELGALWRQ